MTEKEIDSFGENVYNQTVNAYNRMWRIRPDVMKVRGNIKNLQLQIHVKGD